MGHYCQHGTYIQDSWMECPQCCAEDDAHKALEAAEIAAKEARRQTELLEKIERRQKIEQVNKPRVDGRSGPSKRLESQGLAQYAETRHEMGDSYGAVTLISEAIALDPSFPSFLMQRARYHLRLGKNSDVLQDLSKTLEADPQLLSDMEQQLNRDPPDNSDPLHSEYESLLDLYRTEARKIALVAIPDTRAYVDALRSIFREEDRLNTLKNAETILIEMEHAIDSQSISGLLKLPRKHNEIVALHKQSVERVQQEKDSAGHLLEKVECQIKKVCIPYVCKIAREEVQNVQSYYQEAKRLYDLDSFPDHQKCISFSNKALALLDQAERIKVKSISDLMEPVSSRIEEKRSEYTVRCNRITKEYEKKLQEQRGTVVELTKKLDQYQTVNPEIRRILVYFSLVSGIVISLLFNPVFHILLALIIYSSSTFILLYLSVFLFRFYRKQLARRKKEQGEKTFKCLHKEKDEKLSREKDLLEKDEEMIELRSRMVKIKQLQHTVVS